MTDLELNTFVKNFDVTPKEIQSLRDAEWTDAIYKEFPKFNIENIDLSYEEYKSLSFPDRWIKLLKIYLDQKCESQLG